jgi:hypothetical protein
MRYRRILGASAASGVLLGASLLTVTPTASAAPSDTHGIVEDCKEITSEEGAVGINRGECIVVFSNLDDWDKAVVGGCGIPAFQQGYATNKGQCIQKAREAGPTAG